MYIKTSSSTRNSKKYETYQIVESYRNENGDPRQKILLNLGPAHKFLKKDVDSLLNGLLKAKGITSLDSIAEFDSAKSFGQIWAFMHLWNQLKISQTIARVKAKTEIEFDLDSHIKSLVFNRIDDPSSKLQLLTWIENVYIPQIDKESLRYEYLLRAMDFLIEHKTAIENRIADQFLNLFDTSLRLCFYDITSTYFEASKSLTEDDIRKNGYSRDHRSDRKQIVVGVVMNQDGIPLAHYTFDGNTADRSTVKQIVLSIKDRFGVKDITIVADKRMVSGNNLNLLLDNEDDFIFGESVRQTEIARSVIKKAADDRERNCPSSISYVFDTEENKIITYTEPTETGIRKRSKKVKLRFVASYNNSTATMQSATRLKRISSTLFECEQIKLKNIEVEDKYSQIQNLIKRRHLSRMLSVKLERDGILVEKIDEVLKQEERTDGWFLTITTKKDLSK